MNKRLIILSLILLFFMFGCSNQEARDANKHIGIDTTEQKVKEVVIMEEPQVKQIYPLTGEETDQATDKRVVSVMVNNHSSARPQSGLSQADLVFEILAEGNITRFMALFQSESPEVVGPIRSARPYYFNLSNGYEGLYVFHGAAALIKNIITNQGINHLDGAVYDDNKQLFKRESFRVAPHNSYLIFGAVNEFADKKGYEMTREIDPLPFKNREDAVEGESAIHVTIAYPGRASGDVIAYKYNAEKEVYTRFDYGKQTIELHTKAPIELSNVLIFETAHEIIDKSGRREIDLNSGGSAVLIQKGKAMNVEWINQDGKIIPVKEGNPVGFVEGKTWINVIPTQPGIENIINITND